MFWQQEKQRSLNAYMFAQRTNDRRMGVLEVWAKKMAANRVSKCRSCWSRNRRRGRQRRKEKREERRRKVVNDEGISRGGLVVGKAVRDMPVGDMRGVRGFLGSFQVFDGHVCR